MPDHDPDTQMNAVWKEVKALRDLPAPAPQETRAFLDVCGRCEMGTLYTEGTEPKCSLCTATKPLEDRIEELEEALAKAEWGGHVSERVKVCPCCGEGKANVFGDGHELDCPVGLALGRWPGR